MLEVKNHVKTDIRSQQLSLVLGLKDVTDIKIITSVRRLFDLLKEESSDGFPGHMPHVLTQHRALSIDFTRCLYTQKIDGVRAVGVWHEAQMYIVMRDNVLRVLPGASCTEESSIFDCEMKNHGDNLEIVIFDVMSVNGLKKTEFITERFNAMLRYTDTIVVPGGKVVMQTFYNYRSLRNVFSEDWEGVVVYQNHLSYGDGIYKWVNPRYLTVDLRVIAGMAASSDGDVFYDLLELDDGVYSFTTSGEVVEKRSKFPNSSQQVRTILGSVSFDSKTLFKALENVQEAETRVRRPCGGVTVVRALRESSSGLVPNRPKIEGSKSKVSCAPFPHYGPTAPTKSSRCNPKKKAVARLKIDKRAPVEDRRCRRRRAKNKKRAEKRRAQAKQKVVASEREEQTRIDKMCDLTVKGPVVIAGRTSVLSASAAPFVPRDDLVG